MDEEDIYVMYILYFIVKCLVRAKTKRNRQNRKSETNSRLHIKATLAKMRCDFLIKYPLWGPFHTVVYLFEIYSIFNSNSRRIIAFYILVEARKSCKV